jgi:hypothetical protein
VTSKFNPRSVVVPEAGPPITTPTCSVLLSLAPPHVSVTPFAAAAPPSVQTIAGGVPPPLSSLPPLQPKAAIKAEAKASKNTLRTIIDVLLMGSSGRTRS